MNRPERKKAKKPSSQTTITTGSVHIPTDVVISNILIKIPPQNLYDSLRFVSKEWYYPVSTPDFALQNFACSKPKLVLHYPYTLFPRKKFSSFNPPTFDMENGEFIPTGTMSLRGVIINSCRGLLLIRTGTTLQVINPVTNKTCSLPVCPSGCTHVFCLSYLVFDSSSNLFKVVHAFDEDIGYEILSLGVDKAWRIVPAPEDLGGYIARWTFISYDCMETLIIREKIHWAEPDETFIITIDASDETPQLTPTPQGRRACIIEIGGYLANVSIEPSGAAIDIWILKDLKRREWIHQHRITSGSLLSQGLEHDIKSFLPFFSMNSGNVILFRTYLKSIEKQPSYSYDITTGRFKKLKMLFNLHQDFLVHQDSLISWEAPDELQGIY